jgi:predicted DNA-binding WGR domain protein
MRIDFRGNFIGPSVILDRIRPAQNERRFYAASVTTDLFGNILLFRNWGRIGTAGRVRFDLYSGTQEATTALEKLARVKRGRGYENRDHLSASIQE